MSKKILVKESGLMNFFKSFFKAKADGNDPDLADIWVDYDKSLSNSVKVQKAAMDKLGLDSSHIDAFSKKYGIK